MIINFNGFANVAKACLPFFTHLYDNDNRDHGGAS